MKVLKNKLRTKIAHKLGKTVIMFIYHPLTNDRHLQYEPSPNLYQILIQICIRSLLYELLSEKKYFHIKMTNQVIKEKNDAPNM